MSISNFLFQIKEIISFNNGSDDKYNTAPIIVMDQSFTLINAALNVFNNCSIIEYVNWAYEVLIQPNNLELISLMNTRVFYCSTHFFHKIATEANEVLNIKKREENQNVMASKKEIKTKFLQSFTILQNSSSMEDFDEILKNIYNIFCSEIYTLEVMESLKYLDNIIIDRNIDIYDVFRSKSTSIKRDNKLCELWYTEDTKKSDILKNLKNNSKFNHYYNCLLIKIKNRNIQNPSHNVSNRFFNMQLFELITGRLHFSCLWSGLYYLHSLFINKYSYFKCFPHFIKVLC